MNNSNYIFKILYLDDWFDIHKHDLNKRQKFIDFMISNKDKSQFYVKDYYSFSEKDRELVFYTLLTYF